MLALRLGRDGGGGAKEERCCCSKGDIGEQGATALADSGDSGVRHERRLEEMQPPPAPLPPPLPEVFKPLPAVLPLSPEADAVPAIKSNNFVQIFKTLDLTFIPASVRYLYCVDLYSSKEWVAHRHPSP